MGQQISVSASGSVEAPYDIVTFKITVSAVDTTGPLAKSLMKKTADLVLNYVDGLIATGAATAKIVTWSVDPHTRYENHQQLDAGYRASMKITFFSEKMEQALSIQDALTEFDQSKVESLTYGFKDSERLREAATADAWELARRRFNHQVMLAGFDTNRFCPVSWEVHEKREAFSKVAAPTDAKPGMAKVEVGLTVTYEGFWKS